VKAETEKKKTESKRASRAMEEREREGRTRRRWREEEVEGRILMFNLRTSYPSYYSCTIV
jgi:hypothetical protein